MCRYGRPALISRFDIGDKNDDVLRIKTEIQTELETHGRGERGTARLWRPLGRHRLHSETTRVDKDSTLRVGSGCGWDEADGAASIDSKQGPVRAYVRPSISTSS